MSALREAIAAVVTSGHHEVKPDRMGYLIDDLVRTVEGVPVTVTIRDLDMADNENIVTVSSPSAIEYLSELLAFARDQSDDLHLTVDGGALKVKVGGLTWSAPIETQVYEP